MEIIMGSRRSGKTTKLIEMCAENGGYIVCISRHHAHGIAQMARAMKLKIPQSITFDEFISKQYYAQERLYIDDADALLSMLSRVPVVAITMTDNPDSLRYSRQVYKDFDEDNVIASADVTREKYRSIDFGYTSPFVCLYITVDKDERIVIYDEYRQRGCTVEQNAIAITERDGSHFEYTTCDPSGSSYRAAMLENGIPTLAVRTNLMQGVEDVSELLRDKKLLISGNCVETIKEFKYYLYDADGKPQEERCDAMNAVRYFVVNWRRGKLRNVPGELK